MVALAQMGHWPGACMALAVAANKRVNRVGAWEALHSMAWQQTLELTVVGMGYDLVEAQFTTGGLLRVTIDMPVAPGSAPRGVTVDDCERVSRQLQYVLEVEALDYQRLEVGSPGINRLLRNEADLQRFSGALIDLTLHQPMGERSGAFANQRRFRGRLERGAQGVAWQLVWSDSAASARKPGARVGKNAKPPTAYVMQFEWSEVREARLADVVDFKGRAHVSEAVADGADVRLEIQPSDAD